MSGASSKQWYPLVQPRFARRLLLILILILSPLPRSAFAESLNETIAHHHQTKLDHSAVRGTALIVLAKWRDKIMTEIKDGRFLVDAKDTIEIAKTEHSSNIIYGIKSVCRDQLKPGGASNILDPNGEQRPGLSPEQKAALATIRKIFDDPKAKCKNPKNGFVLHAVTVLKEGGVKDWTLDEKKVIQEVPHP